MRQCLRVAISSAFCIGLLGGMIVSKSTQISFGAAFATIVVLTVPTSMMLLRTIDHLLRVWRTRSDSTLEDGCASARLARIRALSETEARGQLLASIQRQESGIHTATPTGTFDATGLPTAASKWFNEFESFHAESGDLRLDRAGQRPSKLVDGSWEIGAALDGAAILIASDEAPPVQYLLLNDSRTGVEESIAFDSVWHAALWHLHEFH